MAAILKVTEQPEGWGGGKNDKGDLDFERVFMVLTETMNVGVMSVLYAQDPVTGVAVPGDFDDYHAGDDALSFAFVRTKKARRDKMQPRLWYVTVTYSSSTETQQRQVAENPLDRPAVYTWGFEQYQRIVDFGIAAKSSAGEPFDPLPVMDDSRPTLTVVRNEPSFNYSRAIDYQDAVNTDVFYGFDPGQCKFCGSSAVKRFENTYTFWEITYVIHFRREKWTLQVLDRGTYQIVGGQIEKMKDRIGHPIEQGLLNGSGTQLAFSGTPVFLSMDVYKKRPFNVLGL